MAFAHGERGKASRGRGGPRFDLLRGELHRPVERLPRRPEQARHGLDPKDKSQGLHTREVDG
jgi:hypothetical protein